MADDPKLRPCDQDDETLVKDLRAVVETLEKMDCELKAAKSAKRSALAGVVKLLHRRLLGSR